MSNSDWKELPNWLCENEYSWFAGGNPQVWAWEFLRRNPAYRADWQQLQSLKANGTDWGKLPEACVHIPAMLEAETERQWVSRCLSMGHNPKTTRFDVYAAEKWGLQQLYDPLSPYQQGVAFLKPSSGIERIFDQDAFISLLEDEILDDGAGIERLSNEKAVLVFDLTRSLEEQCTEALKILRPWKAKMLEAGLIEKADSHAGKVDKWIRHLRVLDALRTTPQPKQAEMAKLLVPGKSDKAAKNSPEKEIAKYIEQATKTMADFRKVLLYKGTPSKITP